MGADQPCSKGLFLILYEHLPVCMYTKRPEEGTGSPELELQTVRSHHISAGR